MSIYPSPGLWARARGHSPPTPRRRIVPDWEFVQTGRPHRSHEELEVLEDAESGCVSSRESVQETRRLLGKDVELRGHRGCRPEINGIYSTVRETWSGRVAYRNQVSQVYLIWTYQPPRWKIVPDPESAHILAYIDCGSSDELMPFEVPGPWCIVPTSAASAAEAIEDPEVSCAFLGQTVVVSGRSGHNQRLNGVYDELPEAYGSFPAYADRQQHLFIYRRRHSPRWVISNRLGRVLRAGRGCIFAEVEEDVPQPYLVRRPWTVHAWAGHPKELDPNISVFLRADVLKDGPPPPVLTVRSNLLPQTEGTYKLQLGKLVNECAVYVRAHDGADFMDKFLFSDGERWCISSSTDDRRKQCDSCSQKREPPSRYHPDCAVWPGLQVLPGNAGVVGAKLLVSLRGRISSMSRHFN